MGFMGFIQYSPIFIQVVSLPLSQPHIAQLLGKQTRKNWVKGPSAKTQQRMDHGHISYTLDMILQKHKVILVCKQ